MRDSMDRRAHRRWKVFATACAIVAATCSPVQAHAQTTVRGTVRAAGPTGEPIAGAVIVLAGQRDSVRSSTNGEFEIRGVSAGNQSLSVRAIGYAPKTVNILVSSAGWTGTVDLDRLPQKLPGVDVTERPTDAEFTTKYDGFFQRRKRGLSGTFRTQEDFQKSGATNMATALAGIPGVSVSTTVSPITGPEYRFRIARCPGNPPNIALYIDGQLTLWDKRSTESFNELMNSILLTDVRYVEFYRGPGQIPSEIERGDNCAVLLIWMR
jgi:hypothetical protein